MDKNSETYELRATQRFSSFLFHYIRVVFGSDGYGWLNSSHAESKLSFVSLFP